MEISGLDNLSRAGSNTNLDPLRKLGVDVRVGDIRNSEDLEQFDRIDWIIDAAANPTVTAGIDGRSSSFDVLDHNLIGTMRVLECCRTRCIPLTLLSTSRVYSVEALAAIPVEPHGNAFRLAFPPAPTDQPQQSAQTLLQTPTGLSSAGISESFSTTPPLSLYGNTKLCSELIALEYSAAFDFPVWINRCSVMGGAGQFGRADQGIFSYWLHSWVERRPLRYLGFGGKGFQVRDCFHPRDLVSVMLQQFEWGSKGGKSPILNFGGGPKDAMSLAQLSDWCRKQAGDHDVFEDGSDRPFDAPWIALDASRARAEWDWQPNLTLDTILKEILDHARQHPHWLRMCTG